MKWLWGLPILLLFLTTAPAALAGEGRIGLNSGSVACEGISIYKDGRYEVVGRCAGLVYPYAEGRDRYVMWVNPVGSESNVRSASVEMGHFRFSARERFDKMFITAESDSSPRSPSDVVIARGLVSRFEFGETETVGVLQPSPSPIVEPSPAAISLSSTLRGALMTLAVVVGVVVAAGIGIWIISRRG